MTSNSTTKKGDDFEKKTFDIIKLLLDNDDFFVPEKRSKVFRKKGYYSTRRQKEIIFDISIETYLDKSSNYSILTLIECKNYNSSVPINDLEEFDSKVRQIGEHNTKGIVITNASFQTGAYEFAKSSGIGLARVNNASELEWIAYRKSGEGLPPRLSSTISLLENSDTNFDSNFLAINDGFVLSTLSDLLIQAQIIDFFQPKENFIKVGFITKERVDYIVSKLESYNLYNGYMLDETKLCHFVEDKYGVKFDFSTNLGSEIMGKITFKPLQILINKSLRSDLHRWRFTLAHEIGHLILHSTLLGNKFNERIDNESSLSFKYLAPGGVGQRIEFQANLFAGSLLIPLSTLQNLVAKYFKTEFIHKTYLYWDNQPVNQQLVMGLLTQISSAYGVSFEVARIRLITEGWLVDDRFKRLKDILKEMRLL